jgi:hypothetical protein
MNEDQKRRWLALHEIMHALLAARTNTPEPIEGLTNTWPGARTQVVYASLEARLLQLEFCEIVVLS